MLYYRKSKLPQRSVWPQIQGRSTTVCHWLIKKKEREKKLSSAAKEESSLGLRGFIKATHTCDRIEPWAPCWRGGGVANDWQKMSGSAHQLHVDTQQADVTVCMIRREGGAHAERKGASSSQSYVNLLKSLGDLDSTGINTRSLVCFVAK